MRTFLFPSNFVSFEMFIHRSFGLLLLTDTRDYISKLDKDVEKLSDEICMLKAKADKQALSSSGTFRFIVFCSLFLTSFLVLYCCSLITAVISGFPSLIEIPCFPRQSQLSKSQSCC